MVEELLELMAQDVSGGTRLDVFLRDALRDAGKPLGRAALTRLIENGNVRVRALGAERERRVAVSYRVQRGDRILITGSLERAAAPDADIALDLVHESETFVIANKPAGMPTHPLAPGERGTLASALVARFPEMASFGYSTREPGIVHRLDTDTSGVVLAARTKAAFDELCHQLDRGAIEKRYLALCRRAPEARALTLGTHAAWLRATGRKVHVELSETRAYRDGARPIETEILRLEPYGPFELLELRVLRAARHQIRAHLAALGHPIAGDTLYGGAELAGLHRHFLHASEMTLTDPASGEPVCAAAKLPPELASALEIAAQS